MNAPASVDELLSAATDIGARLVTEAIWSGDRCTWVGAESLDLLNRTGAGFAVTYRALGPNLYAGSSGVALFLARLAAATGLEEFRPAALAAMRHALSRRDDLGPVERLGFYTGWAGMGVAALRLGSAEFADAGAALLRDVARLVEAAARDDLDSPDRPEFDLMTGMSGTVLALVLGHRLTGDARLANAAATGADWLLRTARGSLSARSWHSYRMSAQRDLTGLSHGAAGVAVALIEAYELTGEQDYATAAREALRYENRWFSAEEGNWPDFRRHADDPRARVFACLWCNGAPGIALSRLHAYERLGDARARRDALTALATTERVTRRLVDGGGADFSLCHGLAGNAECFLRAGIGLEVAELVADHGLERYARTGGWPCGTHSEQTPNLMLGLAGIGYFYLRLADPQVPSVLLPVAS